MFRPTTPLRRLIERAVNGSASETEVTELARLAYKIATARLTQLISSGRLHIQSFNIPIEGIAFDCIGELFQRDGDGVFVELEDCFSGERELSFLSDEEITRWFRHAVFLSIEDGIFRIYREFDPVLGKIIRNLKLALTKESRLASVHRFGQMHITTGDGRESCEHLPMMPYDELESRLSRFITIGGTSVSWIESVVCLLSEESEYRRSIPLVDVALVLKRVAVQEGLPASSLNLVLDSLLQSDITGIVEAAGNVAIQKLRRKYVDRKKISSEDFEAYSQAIREILRDTFVRNDGNEISQVEYLQRSIKGLSWEEYRTNHRSVFEYIVRVAKRLVQKELRELL